MNRRRIVKRVAVAGAVLLAGALAAGGYAWYQWSRLVISIQHEAAGTVSATDVQLSVRGARAAIDQLRVGDHRSLALEPEGESGLELRYKMGTEECHWSGGYVEPTGGYRVVLEIRGCGDVREHTSLWP